MIKLYELNQETRDLLDGFSGHEVELILDYATDLMLEMERYRGRARMGKNSCVELVCALLVCMDRHAARKRADGNGQTRGSAPTKTQRRKGNDERRDDGDHNHGKAADGS